MLIFLCEMSTSDNEDNTDFSKASTARVDDVFISSSSESNEEVDNIVVSPTKTKRKPFFGGYKNKVTGVIYYNVATQTVKPPWNEHVADFFSRDSQTIETKDQIQQTCRDASTQVQVRNVFIQTSSDKSVSPSDTFISADEIQTIYLGKVICVQRFIRRWLAQKELRLRQKSLLDKLAWEAEQRQNREKKDSEWMEELQKRKLYPIKEDDFLLLFSDLQNWWESEAKVISETKYGTDQQEAFFTLLNEEAKKISEINNIKAAVENQKTFLKRHKSLISASKPKLWKTQNKEIAVVTATTQKGQSLKDLYMTLSMKCISTQDRINALHSLIQLLQKNSNSLTNTLLQLAQREVDLLLRGTKAQNLEGLRSRIQDLFWQYVKQPIFNPHMRSQPRLKKSDGQDPFILCCAGCKQFFPLPPNTVNEVVGKNVMASCFVKCKKCLYLENEGWIRKDTELYKKILKLLIEEEEKRPSLSSIIYILQPFDIKHLIETIWKRQSCLSGFAELNELELVRYNAEENWTPWNCMLVTREESAILHGIPNPKDSYDDHFKKFVYQRHIAARSHFATIPRFLPYVTKSTINKDYDSSSEDEDS